MWRASALYYFRIFVRVHHTSELYTVLVTCIHERLIGLGLISLLPYGVVDICQDLA